MARCHKSMRKYYQSAENGLLTRADVLEGGCALAVGLEEHYKNNKII